MILYSYFRSSCAWRVRIALAHKGLQYETRGLDLLKGEQNQESFLKINPMSQVPALVFKDGETALLQSIPIIEYLEEMHPDKPSLLPKDSVSRARVRGISELISSGIQPLQNLAVINKYSEDRDKQMEWGRFWLTKGFIALERILCDTSGQFCFGDEFSMADCIIYPQYASAKRFQLSIAQFPVINALIERLDTLESVKAAHPSNCPDFDPEYKNQNEVKE